MRLSCSSCEITYFCFPASLLDSLEEVSKYQIRYIGTRVFGISCKNENSCCSCKQPTSFFQQVYLIDSSRKQTLTRMQLHEDTPEGMDFFVHMPENYKNALKAISKHDGADELWRTLDRLVPGCSTSTLIHSFSPENPVFSLVSNDEQTGMMRFTVALKPAMCVGLSKEWMIASLDRTCTSMAAFAHECAVQNGEDPDYAAESQEHVTNTYGKRQTLQGTSHEDQLLLQGAHRWRCTSKFWAYASSDGSFTLIHLHSEIFLQMAEMAWRPRAWLEIRSYRGNKPTLFQQHYLSDYVTRQNAYKPFGGSLQESVPLRMLPWTETAQSKITRERLLAVGMAHICRLGKGSPLALLDREVLDIIMRAVAGQTYSFDEVRTTEIFFDLLPYFISYSTMVKK